MWQVVNGGGTAAGQGISGFDLAGKTGTAQVVALGKDSGARKDHSWFVSFAPAWKPEIAMITLIENAGFGGKFAAPATRNVYQTYIASERARLQGWGDPATTDSAAAANGNANANNGAPANAAAANGKSERTFQHR